MTPLMLAFVVYSRAPGDRAPERNSIDSYCWGAIRYSLRAPYGNPDGNPYGTGRVYKWYWTSI